MLWSIPGPGLVMESVSNSLNALPLGLGVFDTGFWLELIDILYYGHELDFELAQNDPEKRLITRWAYLSLPPNSLLAPCASYNK